MVAETWKQLKCSSAWLDKVEAVHIRNGILLGHKKRLNTAFCDNIDRSWEYHAKWNRQKVKNHMFQSYVGYKIESNKWTNKTDKQTKIYTHTALLPEGKKVGGR